MNNEKLTATVVVANLADWSKPYPTGAIVYAEAVVLKSEYCDTPEEYKAFFEEMKEVITPETRLEIRIDADDLDEITKDLCRIREAFEEVRSR